MSSCVKETNEGLDDKNGSAITGENSQAMLLGQLKTLNYSTSQKGCARMNLNNDINSSISPCVTSNIIRKISDSMPATSSLQPRNKLVNPHLSRNDSGVRSTTSSPQCKTRMSIQMREISIQEVTNTS